METHNEGETPQWWVFHCYVCGERYKMAAKPDTDPAKDLPCERCHSPGVVLVDVE